MGCQIYYHYNFTISCNAVAQRSLWGKNLSEEQQCTQQSLGKEAVFPHLILEAGSGPFQGGNPRPAFLLPSWAVRWRVRADQGELKGWEALHVVHRSVPRWFWKVCCLLCGSCWSTGVLQIDGMNTSEKMHDFDLIHWFWANKRKLECLSRMLRFWELPLVHCWDSALCVFEPKAVARRSLDWECTRGERGTV